MKINIDTDKIRDKLEEAGKKILSSSEKIIEEQNLSEKASSGIEKLSSLFKKVKK